MAAPTILMYHGVDHVPAHLDPANMFVHPDHFAEQMDLLASSGYTVVGEDALVAWQHGASLPRKSIVITFDDGYRSIMANAVPVLRKHGFPSTCYVSAGLLNSGDDDLPHPAYGLVDEPGVVELADAGVAIGCHGWDHSTLRGADPADLTRATATARQVLTEITGTAPSTFAYPYGHHDDAALAAVRHAGYDVGLATYDGRGRWALPRVDVNATDTIRTFRLKLNRAFPNLRRLMGGVPAVRRGAHHLFGFAERAHTDPPRRQP